MENKAVLIVDDNPTNLKLAGDILELEGYRVMRALNADAAQKILQETHPALILMDIQMPGMDGLTLTRLIKSNPAQRGIRIAAMTAFAMKGDEEKALAAGCDGYITKPIDTRRFPDQVADLINQELNHKPKVLP